MNWTDKFHHMLYHLWWNLDYLGLKSIKSSGVVEGDFVKFPRELVMKGSATKSVYIKTNNSDENEVSVQKREEVINFIFDYVFAITPSEAVSKILNSSFSDAVIPDFQSTRTRLWERYNWRKNDNVTAADGYFVGDGHVLAIEIKIDASTTANQFSKYLYLMLREEELMGRSVNFNLLYITPNSDLLKLSKQAKLDFNNLDKTDSDFLISHATASTKKYLLENKRLLPDALSRIKIASITWRELSTKARDFCEDLGNSIGDKTLKNLLLGFCEEIESNQHLVQ